MYLAKKLFIHLIVKIMSIKFKVLPKKNPQDITAPEKYYATSIANGETTLESLAEMVCQHIGYPTYFDLAPKGWEE